MFDLTRRERFIAAFLISALLLGLAVSVYNRSHKTIDLEVRNFSVEDEIGDIGVKGYSKKININEAGVEDLMRLEGVGEVLAKRIMEYRSQKGSFGSASELKNVKGIGDRLFEKIKDDVTVE